MVEIIAQRRPSVGLRPLLRRHLQALMGELGYPAHAVTVILCSDKTIRMLKLEHWGEDQATDVLSFPTFEPGDPFVPPHLGDIWISLDTAAQQAKLHGQALGTEVQILAAHALWHLLGHDHQNQRDWSGFERVQQRILTL